jgi:hypothetical protein
MAVLLNPLRDYSTRWPQKQHCCPQKQQRRLRLRQDED